MHPSNVVEGVIISRVPDARDDLKTSLVIKFKEKSKRKRQNEKAGKHLLVCNKFFSSRQDTTFLMACKIIWAIFLWNIFFEIASASTFSPTRISTNPEWATATSSFLRYTHGNEQCSTVKCPAEVTDHLLFNISIRFFQHARLHQRPSGCIWYSDMCSKSPDEPLGFNFAPICSRHDFGYHNLKRQNRFTRELRKRIDVRFREDLHGYCSQSSGWSFWKQVACHSLADFYYICARVFGNSRLMGKHRRPYDVLDTAADNTVSG